jgi:hypothetical protein
LAERKEIERWIKIKRERLMRKSMGEGERRWKGANSRTEE